MAFFGMRFDFRNPPSAGTTMTERYSAGIDMAQWADEHGFVAVVLSEHHGSPDGYLPSALPMAAAVAARTKSLRIMISAIVAPFHHPLRLAEDAAVVDLISGGRLELVLTNGYVADEFAMFDIGMDQRPKRTTKAIEVLRGAWTGEAFDHDGRQVRVTPSPERPGGGGPSLTMGGSTEKAARRAARIGDGFLPSLPEQWEWFRDECINLGKPDPGPYRGPGPSNFHLAEDVEKGWAEVGEYFLHETNAYGTWMADAGLDGMYHLAGDVDAVREAGMYRVLTPDLLIAEIEAAGPYAFVLFHPLLGGIPPDVAWRGLRLFEHDVLPRLAATA
jgi:alkanesulfonate monooxygenase SsuD/methylene tetrahydromethanopterin reductase-like flavin-dependent oxidoreductase (luciferase family)